MSRWLWTLLGGVVLVAIAAFFWTASNRTNVSPAVSPEPTAVAPAPVTPPPASPPGAQEPAASAVQQAASPPAPTPPPAAGAPPTPPVVAQEPKPAPAPPAAAPNPAPNAGQQAVSPRALAPRPDAPSTPPVVAQSPPSAPAAPIAEPPLPPPAPGREAERVRGRICAQEPRAAGRGLGLFRGGLQSAVPAARRRLGLSSTGGQVRSGGDCRVAEEDPSAFRHLPD